jgi:hypothetical protein
LILLSASLTLISINARPMVPAPAANVDVERRMPLARYFYLVGGVLLALLFILDASFPKLPVAAKAKVYLPVIRIYSDRKLPERIIYDTSLPTIVPTLTASTEPIIRVPQMIANDSAGARKWEALAMMPPSGEPLQASGAKMREPKPRHPIKNVRKRAPAPRIAMARHQPFGWFGQSFW